MTAGGLSEQIAALLDDPASLARMADGARALGKPNAASDLADLVERHAAPQS
jgi:UDP-N-acetylglucosamine--N-acetylmuramyl-(pentapeptide) pyrophosphoryl-undecaprenol N-acetylglucosamine transferase